MQKNNPTELEKLLYNKHLAVSRSLKNKPFKIKKNFDDIAETEKGKFLKRISTLVKKHPEIDLQVFFEAPYKLYPDVDYFGLDYFSSMRAVKAYATYKKQLFLQDPDTQVDSVKESLRFITKFCIENNLYLHQYSTHRNSDLFVWMTHYKQNKINVYTMMEFPNIFSSVQTLAEDVQKFFVGEFVEQFKQLQIKYNSSQKLKPFLKQALKSVNDFIHSELTIKHKQSNI